MADPVDVDSLKYRVISDQIPYDEAWTPREKVEAFKQWQNTIRNVLNSLKSNFRCRVANGRLVIGTDDEDAYNELLGCQEVHFSPFHGISLQSLQSLITHD